MKYFLMAVFLLTACVPRTNTRPVTPPYTPYEDFLRRDKNVTCADITKYDAGTVQPICERIYRYHMMAVDVMVPELGACAFTVKMDNVRYIRRAIADPNTAIWPPIGGVLPVMRYTYLPGLRYSIPVYAQMTLVLGVLRDDRKYTYLIEYVTEESIYHEEAHRIAHECGAEWWPEAAHGTETDRLAGIDINGWINDEYKRNKQIN